MLYILFTGREVLLRITVPIGVRAWMAGGGWFQKVLKFLGKTLMIRQKYSGENILKGSQGQVCRLLSQTFASSKRS